MSSNNAYWPFQKSGSKSVGQSLYRYVSRFFAERDIQLDDYQRINAQPFNENSKAQYALSEFHRKLEIRLGFELFALGLVNEGFDPATILHDRHYDVGIVQLLPAILNMELPYVTAVNPGSDVISLLQPHASKLHRMAVKQLDNPPVSNRFSFPHKRHLRVLRSLAYTKNPDASAKNLLTKARDGLDEASIATFALAGHPSTDTLLAGAQTVMDFRAKIQSGEQSVSRDFELDFVMCLVNTSYYWILTGTDVASATKELQRRLAVILPALYPAFEPAFHGVQSRNLMGFLLAYHPEHWSTFGFEAKELLGPSIIDLKESWENETYHFAGVFDGFLSRDFGVDVQKVITKPLLNKHPELRDPTNACRQGSRSSVWSALNDDYTAAADVLNQLADMGVWHRALRGTVTIDLMSEDNCFKAVTKYLEDGGKENTEGAKAALERFPSLIDRVLPTLINKKPTERLASIYRLSPAQIASLPLTLMGVVFSLDLGL